MSAVQDLNEASIGARIVAALARAGMTQTDLARALVGPNDSLTRVESTRRLLAKWIRNEHAPSPDYAARLSEVLSSPADYFLSSTAGRVVTDEDSPVGDALLAREALSLVWDAELHSPTDGELPAQFGVDVIIKRLAPFFKTEHVLIDEVTDWVAGKSVQARARLSADDWKLGEWYVKSEMLPAILVIEALTQTASVAFLTEPANMRRVVLCAGYDHVRIKRAIYSGNELELRAQIRHRAGPIAHYFAEATRDGEQVAHGIFTLAMK